jgi:polysaccharide export outer membrane protein
MVAVLKEALGEEQVIVSIQRTLRALGQALVIVLLACGLAARPAAAQTSATLSPGDLVKISVYGNPDLTTLTRVLPNGTITFPLIGVVAVGGFSQAHAEEIIAAKLRDGGFVKNAAVTIFVQERSEVPTSSVTLLGQVLHSGTYTLDPETAGSVSTLVQLLAKAGGTTDKAADHCFLVRKENGQPKRQRVDLVDLVNNGNIKADITLNNGDVVLVPEMDVFYIYGEVQHPGRYQLDRDMTVMQGISVASGLTPRGSVRGIELSRLVGSEMKTYKSNLDDRMQPNDTLFVKTSVF